MKRVAFLLILFGVKKIQSPQTYVNSKLQLAKLLRFDNYTFLNY